ncbi:MAG TPA: glycerophosphodiester phosphodiesterase family protein [Bacteroidota bacterium]|nr:glycerophosphodiester phosphodiesterase family protein [Bacteroidota bacterium]
MFSWLTPIRFPIIVAHRGSSRHAPENTLAAFRQAMDDGADAIELDVHLSKDGQVIVIHDDRLERTTNGHGRVGDYTLDELRQFSSGEWFHKKFFSEKIPTLTEVFELVTGQIGINIEIKYTKRRTEPKLIVERCIEIISRFKAFKSVLISSFHYPLLQLAKRIDPSIVSGLLYHPVRHFRKSPIKLAKAARAQYLLLATSTIRKKIVTDAHDRNLLVGVYTVNSVRNLRRVRTAGVDSIYTDTPSTILKYLR